MEKWSNEHRAAIVELYFSSGNSVIAAQRQFREKFGLRDSPSKMSILRYVSAFRGTGSVKDAKRSGRPRTARTVGNMESVREAVIRSPKKSVRRLSQELGLKRESVRKILKRDLKLFPYNIQVTQQLLPPDKVTKSATPNNGSEGQYQRSCAVHSSQNTQECNGKCHYSML